MTKQIFPLNKLRQEHSHHIEEEPSGLQVLHVSHPHSLIQAAGYLKHTLASKNGSAVYFRGQTKLFSSVGPGLLRNINDSTRVKRLALLDEFLKAISDDKNALRAVPEYAHEAILQHYGIRTTWLDVVDNIWVALWFACHEAKSLLRGDYAYLHFERQLAHNGGRRDVRYAYILLIESAYDTRVDDQPGHYRDKRSETIDLRVAAPSHFIRPHAQHGVLVRRLSKHGKPVADSGPMHVGTIRVDLEDALDWLGAAATLTVHSLFPPAFYDYGYRELLEYIRPQGKALGSIHCVQP